MSHAPVRSELRAECRANARNLTAGFRRSANGVMRVRFHPAGAPIPIAYRDSVSARRSTGAFSGHMRWRPLSMGARAASIPETVW